MRRLIRTTVAMVGCVVLAGAGTVLGQDWSQWRGPQRDGKAAGFTAPQTWPKTLVQKWQTKVGSGDSTPALVGGKLFVFTRQGDNEVLLCLDAAGGKEVWQDKYAAPPVTGAAARHPGPRSSPTVADGKVVLLGASGMLSCLDAASGKVLWRHDEFVKSVPQFFTSMSPIVVDGLCIAHLGGKENGTIIAYDLASGKEKWKTSGEGAAYGSPVLLTADGAKQVVVQALQNLVGLAVADGKVLWKIPAAVQGRVWNSATPIVDGQTVYFTGQGKGTKAIQIVKEGAGFAAKELWTNAEFGTGYNTPVLKNGLLFGFSERGLLFCLDAKTGKTVWSDKTSRDKSGFGSIVDAGSALVALPSNAELTVYKPSDKQYEELAKIQVSSSTVYAHPVLAGAGVFVKDAETVTYWTIQ